MVQAGRTFRIFVSSTFSDLKEERNALQERVFPRLRELCMQHGCRFQAIDLRWGVSEEASLDQQTMNICLSEIERCRRVTPRPNFIVLLGDRYGWRPLPPQIPAHEFEEILQKVSDEERDLLLWDESQPADRKGWYRRDDNAVPPEYCLQPRSGKYEDYDTWTAVERRLHSILMGAVKDMPLEARDWLKYEASATEQEIAAGALRVEGAEMHVGCFLRSILVRQGDGLAVPMHMALPKPDMKDFVDLGETGNHDTEARGRLEQLTSRLRSLLPVNIHEYPAEWMGNSTTTDHIGDLPEELDACLKLNGDPHAPRTLCLDVWRWLSQVILEEVSKIEHADPLESEVAAHDEFGRERGRHFIGRADILNTISAYLGSRDSRPLVIYGESGSGKSALMARAVERASMELRDTAVIARFIGATPDSSDGRSLLESLCRQIYKVFSFDEQKAKRLAKTRGADPAAQEERRRVEQEYSIPSDFQDLAATFQNFLTKIPAGKTLVVFLDALDQLSDNDNARNLAWLPARLPPNVRFIVCTLPGQCLSVLEKKLPKESLLELQPMPVEEGATLLELWLKEAGRTLQAPQQEEVLAKFRKCALPLYLRLAFEEARRWKSYSTGSELSADIPGVTGDMFRRLSLDSNHGSMLVCRSLGYLAASRHGLSEDEMVDVLSLDEEVRADFKRRSPRSPDLDRLPVVVWSRLYFDLEPYLTERTADGTTLMTFYHLRVGEAAMKEFLEGESKRQRHHGLAGYFGLQPLWIGEDGKRIPNLRKVSELPYQQTLSEQRSDVEQTLTDLTFIEAKCAAGMTYDLVADYGRLGAGGLQYGPPICTTWLHKGRHGGLCPFCLAWSQIPPQQLGKEAICPSCGNGLKFNAFAIAAEWHPSPARSGVERLDKTKTAILTPRIAEFADFVRIQRHVLVTRPMLTFQQAANEPDNTAPALVARHRQASGLEVRPWLRRTNKPHNKSPCLMTVTGLPRGKTVSFSPDGKRMVSAYDRTYVEPCNTLKLCDAETGMELDTLAGHTELVTACAFSPDGTRIVSGSRDGVLKLWDAETGMELATLAGHTNEVTACAFSPDGARVVSGSQDRMLKLWDAETGMGLVTLKSPRRVESCAFSPDGMRVVSGFEDGMLTLWDTTSGVKLVVLVGHSPAKVRHLPWPVRILFHGAILRVNACAFSPDGKRIVSASGEGTLRLWDAEKGARIATLTGHSDAVTSCAFSPDGTRIVSGSLDRTVKLWDARTGTELATLVGHLASVEASAFSRDGMRIVSVSWDGVLKVWDASTLNAPPTVAGHKRLMNACDFSPDGRQVLSASEDHTLKLWDAATGKELATFAGHRGPVNACAFSPDAKHVASGSSDGKLKLWDTSLTRELGTLSGQSHWVKAALHDVRFYLLLFLGGAMFFIVGGSVGFVLGFIIGGIWQVIATGLSGSVSEVIRWAVLTSIGLGIVTACCVLLPSSIEFVKESRVVTTCAFSKDGTLIVSGSGDKTLRLWDVATRKELAMLTGHGGRVNACALSPDGTRIVSGSVDLDGDIGELKMWDVATRAKLGIGFAPILGEVRACAFSPDGRLILAQGILWDSTTGREVVDLGGNHSALGAFSADGKTLACRSREGALVLLEVATGREIGAYWPEGTIHAITWSPDGCLLALGDDSGSLHLLRAENMVPGPPICTAWHSRADVNHAFGCPHCRSWSEVPESALGREVPCPRCGKHVKLNPFTIDADWRPIAEAWGEGKG